MTAKHATPPGRWVAVHFWRLWWAVIAILAIYAAYLIISGTPLTRTCLQWQ